MAYRNYLHNPSDSLDLLGSFWDSSAGLLSSQPSPQTTGATPSPTSVNPSSPPVSLPAETYEAQAAVSASGSGGPGSVVSETSGGLTINVIFDAAAMAAPASFRAGIEQAAALLSAAVTDKITLNFQIDYSGTGGGAAAGPDNGQWLSYSTVRGDLVNNASPGDASFNALPSGSSIQGQSSVAVWNAQLKLWGLLGANDTTTDDGSATFATDINPNLLVGVALHELTHAMGRVPYGSEPDVFDFYRFTSPGARLFTNNIPANAAYFSLDGGNTKLADYGQNSDPSDFLNSGVQGGSDPFNEYYSGSTLQQLTAIDLKQLDALGFHTEQLNIAVSPTATEAIQGGSAIALLSGPPTLRNNFGSILTSATIQIGNANGNAIAGDELYINGQQSGTVDGGLVTVSWNDVSKTLTLTGNASLAAYQTLLSQITYQDNGSDTSIGSHPQHTLTWTINDGTATGSTTSEIAIERAPVATVDNVTLGANATTVAASSLFAASDPDGDAIVTFALKDAGNGYFALNGVAQPNNQEIDLTASQFEYLSYVTEGGSDTLQVRVSDGTLWSSWQSFGLTGPAAAVVESSGSTKFVQVGNDYYLANISTGIGPELYFGGAPVTVGMWAGWAPIGAEQTLTGYDVAFHNASTGLFNIWSTDNNGNYITNLATSISGTSSTLENFETIFHQDLNGDGIIGLPPPPPPTMIESSGVTSLVQSGSDYLLDPAGGGTGPELYYAGAPVTVGMWTGWAPVGAEQTATGYDVAFHNASTGLFNIWSTDSNGNYITNLASGISGTSSTLENFETIFHQDLNGDGTIGPPPPPPPTVIEAFGVTSLVQSGSDYFLNPAGGATGPGLYYAGAPVTLGMWAGWAPVGAEQTSTGYDVAFHNASTGLFNIWSTDSNGNYMTNLASVISGSSSTLENFETIFHQDLNGDGTIGPPPPPPPTVIEAFGVTSLVQSGSDYFLNPTGGGTGPELYYSGAPVTAGMWAGWAPVGAEQTSTGYDVAFHNASTGLFNIWSTDSGGNYIINLASGISGTSSTLENFETIFHQDLNGDGTIGVPAGTSPAAAQPAQASQTSFDGHTLTLDAPSTFSGELVSFGGDGALASSDQVDLRGFNFDTLHSTFDSGCDMLSLSSGSSTASVQFLGQYLQDSFHFADDGNGGTLVVAATQATATTAVSNFAAHNTFVFAPNFGNLGLPGFTPATDSLQFSKTVFSDVTTLLAATHDDGSGNAIITDAAHDTITLQHVTTAQLMAHQSDFHFV